LNASRRRPFCPSFRYPPSSCPPLHMLNPHSLRATSSRSPNSIGPVCFTVLLDSGLRASCPLFYKSHQFLFLGEMVFEVLCSDPFPLPSLSSLNAFPVFSNFASLWRQSPSSAYFSLFVTCGVSPSSSGSCDFDDPFLRPVLGFKVFSFRIFFYFKLESRSPFLASASNVSA